MLLFQALSFFFVTMGRKKIPCTCVPTCKTDAARRQKRSKAKRKQQALPDQAFALAVAACSAAGVAAVCGAAVTAAALLIGADSQSQQSQPSQPSQPAPQTPAKRLAAPSTMGAPLKKVKQPTLFEPPPPPLPMHMYGQTAQNGRLWVTFFVTKYRDFFFNQGGGGPGRTHPARCIRPCFPQLSPRHQNLGVPKFSPAENIPSRPPPPLGRQNCAHCRANIQSGAFWGQYAPIRGPNWCYMAPHGVICTQMVTK